MDLSEFDGNRRLDISVGVFRFSMTGDFQTANGDGEGEKVGRVFGGKLASALLPVWSTMEDMHERAVQLGVKDVAKGTADPPGQAIEAILAGHKALIARGVSRREASGFVRGARLQFHEGIRSRNSLDTSDLERIDQALAEAEDRSKRAMD